MRSAIHKKENREVGPIVIPGERARSLRLQTADMVLIASCPSDKLCLGDVSFWGIFVTKQIKIEVRLLASLCSLENRYLESIIISYC